jgi:hypothetical protein
MDHVGLLIRLAVELRRLENGAAALVSGPLNSFFADSLALLDSDGGDAVTRLRVGNRFIAEFDQSISNAINQARATAMAQVVEIAAYQSERTAQILSSAAGNVFTADGVSRARLQEILNNDAIEGQTADQWWRRLEAQIRLKAQRVVAESLTNGESVEQIKQRVDDLVVKPAIRQAESLTRTVASNLANAAQFEAAEANPHLTRGYRLLFTLDRRTSLICLAWSEKSRNKIYPYAPESPRPPFHFQCRTIIAPVPIGLEGEEAVEAGDWLKRQSDETQNVILGSRRAELFRKGRLQLEQLIRSDNSIATIPELRGVAGSFQI